MTTATSPRSRAAEWQTRLLAAVGGLLVFETLTGLSIYLLPFSVSNQIMVLLHTLVGLVFVIPLGWYQVRHWNMYRGLRLTHIMLTGYFASVATFALILSGLVLTFQAVFSTRISYAWDLVHIIATFALIASVVPHVVTLVWYNRKGRKPEAAVVRAAEKSFAWRTAGVTAVLFAVLGLTWYAYEPTEMHNELPADYSYLYGPDRPFAPSLANTSTGQAFDSRSLGGSESCGTAGCHVEILEEWKVSSHRWSAMDVAFQTVQNVMAEQNGAETTRYCGGCHDPISLFSGTKNVFTEDLTNLTGYQEGVSCLACHAIKETDVQGNAAYVITQPERYMFELRDGKATRFVRDFLIRSYPRHHVESLEHRLFKSPEFCAACHKQFIDEEINQVGWVQLQNQFDNWRKSRWNEPGDPTKTIECRECHMPLLASTDPSSGDAADYNRSPRDGKHRSHRFLAGNQFMPLALELEGAQEHVDLTEQWLQGKIEIPEIAHKWQAGPAIPVEIRGPASVRPGQNVELQALVTNNKVGHDFPTGPLDIIQAWVELIVTDDDGNVVFESGTRDEKHFIKPGSFMFKAEPVDQYGNLIDRHNLWEMVGVRYRRSLFPGFSDQGNYNFVAPSESGTTLHVSAKLLYRKFDQFLLNFLFGEESGLTAPITVISEDAATITVTAAAIE